MGKIQLTRHDYIKYGTDCDGYYYIALFFRNLKEKYNSRYFLTGSLYRSALSKLKKCLKNYKGQEDELFLSEDDCRKIYQYFDKLEFE